MVWWLHSHFRFDLAVPVMDLIQVNVATLQSSLHTYDICAC